MKPLIRTHSLSKTLGVDNKVSQEILSLMFQSSENYQKEKRIGRLLSHKKFNVVLKELLRQDFLGRDTEWVLVIPLDIYLRNAEEQYELIFGRGQTITNNDLFLKWDNKKRSISILNLKVDSKRSNVISLQEAYNLSIGYGTGMTSLHPHQIPLLCTSIEHIKERLIWIKNRKYRMVEKLRKESFLLKPNHLGSDLKYLNVTINVLKFSSLILLRDVFNEGYSFDRDKISWDAYTVIRKFLRTINLFPERRAGIDNRLRLSKDDLDDIKDHVQMDKEGREHSFWSKQVKLETDKISYLCYVVSEIKNQPVTSLNTHQQKLLSFLNQNID